MTGETTIPAVQAQPGQVLNWNGLQLTVAGVTVNAAGWTIIRPPIGNSKVIAPGGTVRVVEVTP